ncbi:voltage-dependent calcium channel gamma-5 subunit [Rhinoderma darwinii]|uniref:voltage-dependent calcium channel gamma-5 subunit n=1 Tax=Rhinoderma darwinii TaxID=43563 RepID=UPI003F676597
MGLEEGPGCWSIEPPLSLLFLCLQGWLSDGRPPKLSCHKDDTSCRETRQRCPPPSCPPGPPTHSRALLLLTRKPGKLVVSFQQEVESLLVTQVLICTLLDLMLCGMGACSRKALTLLSSVFAVCSLGLLGIAVSTDYWLYLEEGIILPQNQTTEIKMSLHSGLWRVCFLAGEEQGRCFTIEYVMPMNVQMTSESTISVLKMIRSATPFPLVSLFFMFIGFILNNVGHIRPHRTILAFVSGIFFILSGLSLVVGLVLYISSINDEILNRTKDSETYFTYKYGWSFAFAAISFLLTESAGVMSVYLFMKRYTAEDAYRPHPGYYRPRLSNCSDYSGQFLHPEAWVRGRSPSDISSEASLPMNSNYPALLKCPDYDQMSSSPC